MINFSTTQTTRRAIFSYLSPCFLFHRLTRNKVAVNPVSFPRLRWISRYFRFTSVRVFRLLPTTYQEYPRIAYLSTPLISGSKRNDRETANDTVPRSLSASGGCYFYRENVTLQWKRPASSQIKVRGTTSGQISHFRRRCGPSVFQAPLTLSRVN